MNTHRCTAVYTIVDRRTGKEIILQCALNDGHDGTHYANEGRVRKEWGGREKGN